MKIRSVRVGTIPLILVENGLGLRVYFSTYGASIYAIFFNDKIMTLSAKEAKDFARRDIYYGKTIGPIAGRIKDGIVEINGKTYNMKPNEGNNVLHGGDYNVSSFLFAPKITNNSNVAFSIRYTFNKKDMRDGLPGNVKYVISYYVSATDNVIMQDIRVIPSEDTVLALTNHSYFCLGDSDIKNLILTIPANKYVEPNATDLVPTKLKDVPPCLDFNKRKPIYRDIEDPYLVNSRTNGYDHYFLKNNRDLPVILENSHYILEIKSNFEGLVVYSDNYPDNAKVVNSDEIIHRAVALEPMDNPLDRKITKRNEIYQREIIYKFIKK